MNEQHIRSIAWATDRIMEASDADETKPKESGQIMAGTGQGEGADYLYLERGLGRNMGDGL
jgi:hypothetical protein